MIPLLRSPPELLVVQGDTSTALGAALAAFTSGVALAHVEAGLRTYDPLLPWPEEEYRAAIDAGADLLFAPTEFAASNLRAENVPGEIHVTGSTGIDAALGAASRLPPPVRWERATRTILVVCDRPERLDDDLESIAAALADLGNDGSSRIELLLHQDPLIAANMRLALAGMHGVALLEPGGMLPTLDNKHGAAHRRLLARYIRYHLAEGAELPALEFWMQQPWAAAV